MADVDVIVTTVDKTAKGMKDAERRMKKFSDEWTTRNKSFQSMEKQKADSLKKAEAGKQQALQATMTKFAAYAASAVAVGAALKKAYDFGEEGANLLRLEKAHEQLAGTAIDANNGILASLQKASMGTVANSDLILASNQAMMLGLGKDAEKLGNLMQVASHRGRAMGLTTTQAFSDIVRGVGRMSPLILDNLGIVIDAESRYGDYADSIGKTASELTAAEKRQALFNAVLEEGNAQIAEAGGLAEDAATNFERARASSKNYTDELKKQGSALSGLAGWYADSLDQASLYAKKIAEINEEVGFWNRTTADSARAQLWAQGITRELTSDIDSATRSYIAWGNSIETTTDTIEEGAASVQTLTTSYAGILALTQSMQSSSDSFNDKQETTRERIDETLEAIQKSTIATGANSNETAELISKYDELTASVSENRKEFEKSSSARLLEQTKKKLTETDGILTTAEELYLLDLGLSLGVYTETVVTESKMMLNEADKLAAGFTESTETVTSGITTASDLLSSVDGQTATMSLVLETVAAYDGIPRSDFENANEARGFSGVPIEQDNTGLRGRGRFFDTPTGGSGGAPTVNVSIGAVYTNSQGDVNYLIQQIVRGLQP